MGRLVKKLINRPRTAFRRVSGRARFRRSIRPSDVFIVTFPKSGTNWVGFLLALVAADRATGSKTEITLGESSDWVRGVNEEYSGGRPLLEDPRLGEPRVFKIHAPCDPIFPRVIYVVRDPRDVMVSYYYHNRRKKLKFEISIDEYVARNDTWPCDWGDHVAGWLSRADQDDVLIIRYEDLKENTQASFRRIVDFCGLDLSDEQLTDYIERSSFDRMSKAEEAVRELEAAAGVTEARDDLRFMRRGVVGDWKTELSAESVRLIEERYGDLMASLGYDLAYRRAE
jgi:hypothetical protein